MMKGNKIMTKETLKNYSNKRYSLEEKCSKLDNETKKQLRETALETFNSKDKNKYAERVENLLKQTTLFTDEEIKVCVSFLQIALFG